MQAFYFDYKILGGESVDEAERKLRQRLQRQSSAKESLAQLSAGHGLYGIAQRSEKQKERAW